MLTTKVILSRVTNLSDARYASGMGVDYIGFDINPDSDQYVTAEQVKLITEWLSGVGIIGNIGTFKTNDSIDYKLNHLQTNNLSVVDELSSPIIELTLTSGNLAETEGLLNKYQHKAAFFIIKVDEDSLQALRSELTALATSYKIYISTNFSPQNIDLVVKKIKPEGIVIYGSNEEKPGLSSYDGIADILEQIEV